MDARRLVTPSLQVQPERVGNAATFGFLPETHLVVRLMQKAPCDERTIEPRVTPCRLEPGERMPSGAIGIERPDHLCFLDRLRDQDRIARGRKEWLHEVNPEQAVRGRSKIESRAQHAPDRSHHGNGLHQPGGPLNLDRLERDFLPR